MTPKNTTFKKGEIICKKGDKDQTLFLMLKGKALVFGIEGTQVTPFAHISENEFIGELAFFDREHRSAYVVALEECELMTIPTNIQNKTMPDWMIKLATNMTKRIRSLDEAITKNGIKRKKNIEGIKPLTIQEQREILQALGLV